MTTVKILLFFYSQVTIEVHTLQYVQEICGANRQLLLYLDDVMHFLAYQNNHAMRISSHYLRRQHRKLQTQKVYKISPFASSQITDQCRLGWVSQVLRAIVTITNFIARLAPTNVPYLYVVKIGTAHKMCLCSQLPSYQKTNLIRPN